MRRVGRALLSVSDKTGLVALGKFLSSQGVELLSTGGTATQLRQAGLKVMDVAEFTGSPEMLDGRVKTLHPKVHGGLLAVRGNTKHEEDMRQNNIQPIDLVVLNLYPFEQTVKSGADFDTCVENVDIGGPSMLRSSAKNHASVVIVSDPSQYEALMEEMQKNNGATTLELRRKFAAAAFSLSARYDTSIAKYFNDNTSAVPSAVSTDLVPVTRTYTPVLKLKYGANPHQVPAAICSFLPGNKLPFKVLNGTPGYINLLDAVAAWQLVKELRQALGLAAAASFKHVSPAGAAVAVPLSSNEAAAYELTEDKVAQLTPASLAYVRARNADPMCSFGDFAAISEIVDEATANFLKTEVSDGIIARGFEPKALEILKAKKNGGFIVLEADPDFNPTDIEYREVFGMCFAQRRNDRLLSLQDLTKVVTKNTTLSDEAKRDLLLASISIKYTQSNSVGYACGGQMVGVGAGQQSRVDCVKLAGRKVAVWYLRQHPKVMGLKFKPSVKRQERVNARVRYIEGDMTEVERATWETQFEEVPTPLTQEEKEQFVAGLKGVSLSSDAFFPFRDSIDHASKLGVSYIVQPGGSVQDAEVIAACDAYGMSMAFSGVRLFTH
jgi:phosphoribosylaminoimidazolecarboxamide formyltransferase/IMP cyclohydrolase